MTEATGSQSQNQPPSKAPWEQAWNDVKDGLSVIGESMSSTFIPKSPPGTPSPWERMWGSDKPPTQARKTEPRQAAAPDNWDDINKRYAQGKGERDAAQLVILQNELASVKDPKHKAILQREIARVGGIASVGKGAQLDGANNYDNGTENDEQRKEFESLRKVSAKDVIATGFDSLDKRNEWVAKMDKEFAAATKGMSRAEKDKAWSTNWVYAKDKYPKEAAAFLFFNNNSDIKGPMPDAVKSYLETYNPDMSFPNAQFNARGWVYNEKDQNRVFLGNSADYNTMVHETEHLRQHRDLENTGHFATVPRGSGAKDLRDLTYEMRDDPAIKKVFRATNAHDSSEEWLANLAGFWRTGIPEGKSWSDTPFYKKIVEKVGKEKAHEMLLDSLMRLQRAPYTQK